MAETSGASQEPGHNRPVRATVTIRDVARLAEVHPGTVSRALNEQTRALVNEDTAERAPVLVPSTWSAAVGGRFPVIALRALQKS